MGRACSMHGGYKNVYKILVGQPDDKRTRHRLEDNIKVDLKEIKYMWTDSSGSGQN
jgi:hypothetical protein